MLYSQQVIIQNHRRETETTNPSYSSSLHSFITERAWPFLSVTEERDRDTQVEREGRGEKGGKRGKQMERHWDGQRPSVHARVWSHVECVFDGCQKKVGQRISHHLLRGGEDREKRRRWRKNQDERGMKKKQGSTGEETRGAEKKGMRRNLWEERIEEEAKWKGIKCDKMVKKERRRNQMTGEDTWKERKEGEKATANERDQEMRGKTQGKEM